jgi:exodeoxyribonuclease-1
MSENRQDLVFLDTETVSLRTDINQIIQFAAIVVDADFVVKEKINLRIRLKKTIPIGVGACLVTGNKPLDLFSKECTDMSEYEFAKYLMKLIEGRIIVGYNNHGYDDSMLSQCLFQNLQPAYFHKYSSNGSLDALTLVAAVTNMTNKYKHKTNVKGNAELKLGSWCEANGIVVDHGKTHDALYDVELTLEAVNLIRARDPKIFEDWFKSRSTRHVNNRLMTELYINNINIYFGKVYSQ